MEDSDKNIAYIDAQNLHMGTAQAFQPWQIDLTRFRKYLSEKYKVKTAFYCFGCIQNGEVIAGVYRKVEEAGFILTFRQHNSNMIGNKKGNVDSDIIFSIMKLLYKNENFGKVVLVSGDGDYKILVDFLIEEGRFKKILFPNTRFASSLYKELNNKYYDFLENNKKKFSK